VRDYSTVVGMKAKNAILLVWFRELTSRVRN